MESHSLLADVEAHLTRELGDRHAARALAGVLHEDVLSWRAPETDAARFDTMVAFTLPLAPPNARTHPNQPKSFLFRRAS